MYSVLSDKKACIVERFNRTSKMRMFRAFTERRQEEYIDILQDLVSAYNNTVHRSIKKKPADVNRGNELLVWQTLYSNVFTSKIKFKFQIGDKVRQRIIKDMYFEKGYTENWTEEVFIITGREVRVPPIYRIKDLLDNVSPCFFYEYELQKILKNNDDHEENDETASVYLIEKVIRTRVNKQTKEKESFIKWVGYNSSHNSWIKSSVQSPKFKKLK